MAKQKTEKATERQGRTTNEEMIKALETPERKKLWASLSAKHDYEDLKYVSLLNASRRPNPIASKTELGKRDKEAIAELRKVDSAGADKLEALLKKAKGIAE